MARGYGRSPIGKPGPKKGPSKTSMNGSIRTGNLGRVTTAKSSYGGNNHDVGRALSRGIQGPGRQGPGGNQRP